LACRTATLHPRPAALTTQRGFRDVFDLLSRSGRTMIQYGSGLRLHRAEIAADLTLCPVEQVSLSLGRKSSALTVFAKASPGSPVSWGGVILPAKPGHELCFRVPIAPATVTAMVSVSRTVSGLRPVPARWDGTLLATAPCQSSARILEVRLTPTWINKPRRLCNAVWNLLTPVPRMSRLQQSWDLRQGGGMHVRPRVARPQLLSRVVPEELLRSRHLRCYDGRLCMRCWMESSFYMRVAGMRLQLHQRGVCRWKLRVQPGLRG
jgi:hypothetical protein